MDNAAGHRKPMLVPSIRRGVAMLVLIAMAALCYDIVQLARAIDSRTLEQEAARLRGAITAMGEATAAEHLLIASSPQTRDRLLAPIDDDWFTSNFWPLAVLDDAEYAAIIDPETGRLIALSPMSGRNVGLSLAGVLSHITRGGAQAERAPAFLPGAHRHEIMMLAEGPAQVVTIAIAPIHLAADSGGAPPLFVHVTPINDRIVRSLAAMSLLRRLVLSTGSGSAAADNGVLALLDGGGDGTGQPVLAWRSEQPGTTVLRALLPLLALPALVMLLFARDLIRRLTDMAKRLQHNEAAALELARSDPMTGLANRRWFRDRLNERMAGVPRTGFGLVLIDVDHFKTVNDTFGHAAGDAVLKFFAERLRLACAGGDFAARLGGDEFALATMGQCDRKRLVEFCDKLAMALAQPVHFEGREIATGASIGAALWPSDGGTLDEVLAAADLALYRAKRDGRGCARMFDGATDMADALRASSKDTSGLARRVVAEKAA